MIFFGSANCMITLARNENNDLFARGGGFALAHEVECEIDVVLSEVNTQKGELQFDNRRGIDYFGTVFESPKYAGVCMGQISSAISKMSWVKAIKNKKYEVIGEERAFRWSVTIETIKGEEITVGSFNKGEASEMGINWDDIVGKPKGLDTVSERLGRLASLEAENLTRADSTADVKNRVNSIIGAIKSAKEG